MSNELVVFEEQLRPLSTHFEEALAGVMPVDRLIRTALISAEKNPYLLQCDRQSFFNTIMSAGVLGLEMDGVTGQAFPIPFKKRIQLVIGYKGYNTLGARAGLTITGEVAREGDEFDYLLGTGAFVKHKPKLDNQGRIIGAWAQAASSDRPPIISILGIGDILAVKDKSPGAKKEDSPWNDPRIGFPAMASKTAKRRLARSTPLTIQTRALTLAARMEEAFEEQGQAAFITRGHELVIEGGESPIADRHANNETPTAEALMAPRAAKDDGLQYMRDDGMIAAKEGTISLQIWWKDLPPTMQHQMKEHLDKVLKPAAAEFDKSGVAA